MLKKKRIVKYECLTCGYVRPGMYCFCEGGKGLKRLTPLREGVLRK